MADKGIRRDVVPLIYFPALEASIIGLSTTGVTRNFLRSAQSGKKEYKFAERLFQLT